MDRQSAELALHNGGYEHPENNNHTKSSYKKYISNEKNPYTSCSKNRDYKTTLLAYEHDRDRDVKNLNTRVIEGLGNCPVCSEIAEFRCTCKEFREVKCKNNHYWFMLNNTIIVGDPHNLEK